MIQWRSVMKGGKMPERETLTEACEVRALRDESGEPKVSEAALPEAPHAEPGALQTIKKTVMGHGEQTVLPDDGQFGDNYLCHVDG
jgi:hypothetical protein